MRLPDDDREAATGVYTVGLPYVARRRVITFRVRQTAICRARQLAPRNPVSRQQRSS
jgi:hypothetical protein